METGYAGTGGPMQGTGGMRLEKGGNALEIDGWPGATASLNAVNEPSCFSQE